jgi:hypothetical protein
MTPQEKIRWFWSVGELPCTMFEGLNGWKGKVPEWPRRQQVKRLRQGLWKRHEGAS